MCYKHGGSAPATQKSPQSPQAQNSKQMTLIPNFYFQRVASQHGCTQCQERVSPEEVKSALGVCTVYLVKQTIQWMTNKE